MATNSAIIIPLIRNTINILSQVEFNTLKQLENIEIPSLRDFLNTLNLPVNLQNESKIAVYLLLLFGHIFLVSSKGLELFGVVQLGLSGQRLSEFINYCNNSLSRSLTYGKSDNIKKPNPLLPEVTMDKNPLIGDYKNFTKIWTVLVQYIIIKDIKLNLLELLYFPPPYITAPWGSYFRNPINKFYTIYPGRDQITKDNPQLDYIISGSEGLRTYTELLWGVGEKTKIDLEKTRRIIMGINIFFKNAQDVQIQEFKDRIVTPFKGDLFKPPEQEEKKPLKIEVIPVETEKPKKKRGRKKKGAPTESGTPPVVTLNNVDKNLKEKEEFRKKELEEKEKSLTLLEKKINASSLTLSDFPSYIRSLTLCALLTENLPFINWSKYWPPELNNISRTNALESHKFQLLNNQILSQWDFLEYLLNISIVYI